VKELKFVTGTHLNLLFSRTFKQRKMTNTNRVLGYEGNRPLPQTNKNHMIKETNKQTNKQTKTKSKTEKQHDKTTKHANHRKSAQLLFLNPSILQVNFGIHPYLRHQPKDISRVA